MANYFIIHIIDSNLLTLSSFRLLVISMIWGPWVYVHIFQGFPVWKHINRAKCSRNISQKAICGVSLSLEEEYVRKYSNKI